MTRSSKKRTRWSLKALAAAGALALGLTAAPKPAAAQEIQLTGPLAGAPSVRKQRLYREGRFELALGPGFTLLDEYERTIFLSGRLQYNIWDWLAVGVFGGFSPDSLSLDTDLTDKIEAQAPRNSRTAVNLPGNRGAPAFDQQTGKLSWMVTAPQVTFTPFRGKLALFQKLFIDTDIYGFGGLGIIGVKDRGDCGATGQTACTAASSFATQDRVALAPVFGLGWTFYPANMVSFGVEYRAFPFKYNRGGFDSRGGGNDASFPDNKVDSEDRTLKFNQMVFLFVGFSLPTLPTLSK
jgi:hypothetical protein